MDLFCFLVQAFKKSALERLHEEGLSHRSQESLKIVRAMICSIEAKI